MHDLFSIEDGFDRQSITFMRRAISRLYQPKVKTYGWR